MAVKKGGNLMAKDDSVLSQTMQAIEEKAINADKKVRVGIIGTGWIAESHIEQYKKFPDVELVAMADLIPGKAEKFCRRNGIDPAVVHFYPDHKSMLENEQLDAVSICTYNATHAVCAIDSLNAGVNVLLEKPFTVTLDEAVDYLVEAFPDWNLKSDIVYNFMMAIRKKLG